MIAIPYNPFKCELPELKTQDLITLKSVAEGWYVEYKSGIVKSKNIAKSLAAFANHYGGWLFYGVAETTDGSNYAGSFPGVKSGEISILLDNIRNAAKDSINPCPYYDYKVLDGPSDEIGLPCDRSVIVVIIPCGSDAPYIHSDGRIYRRVADSSDPRPETDRYILDLLWQRRQRAHEKLKVFLEQRPELSKGEDETSFVHLFLSIDPLGIGGHRINLTFDRFKELMADSKSHGMSIGISFDNFFTTSDGIICRLVGINDPYRLLLTFKYNFDASAQISIPISSTSIFELVEIDFRKDNMLNGYEQANEIVRLLKEQRFRSGQLLDINNLFFIITAVFGHYKKLLDESKVTGEIYAKAMLENTWRRIPFLDTQEYIKYVKHNGFPLIQTGESFAPPGTTFDSLRVIAQPKNHKVKDELAITQQRMLEVSPIMANIANALGIPGLVMFDSNGDWIKASNRASHIAQKRSDIAMSE